MAGKVCAPRHVDLEVPYRVLFVVDTSLSNEWNDPMLRRVAAVKNAIDANLPRPNVSFGVITFSDVPRVQTLAFTRDPLVLTGAVSHIGTPQGATNYADTLWTVKSFLLDDLNAMSPLDAARTHYLVFWLSDGFPTVGTTDPRSIVPMVSTLKDLVTRRVAELRIDTAFLGARTSSAAEAAEAAEAKKLLEAMATAGNGHFNDIPAGQAFGFDIDLRPLRAYFDLEAIIATNRNLIMGEKGPLADSDGDGLSDEQELALGLDPTLEDTDGDGFRDGVEWNSTGRLDPLTKDPVCTDLQDSDGDGLRNCEEAVVSTLPGTVDTDGDRLPDGLELLGSGTPVDDRPSLDRDEDGLPDQAELRAHMPVLVHNTQKSIDGWSYRYEVKQLPRDPAATEDVTCYAVNVDNLAMVPTLATPSHPVGVNQFELHTVFALQAGTAPRWNVAHFEGRLLEDPYVLVPASNRFDVSADKFTSLP